MADDFGFGFDPAWSMPDFNFQFPDFNWDFGGFGFDPAWAMPDFNFMFPDLGDMIYQDWDLGMSPLGMAALSLPVLQTFLGDSESMFPQGGFGVPASGMADLGFGGTGAPDTALPAETVKGSDPLVNQILEQPQTLSQF